MQVRFSFYLGFFNIFNINTILIKKFRFVNLTVLSEIFRLFADDKQPSEGRPELGDRAFGADDHAVGEGIVVAGADLIRGSPDGPTSSGSRRSAEPHQAEIDVLGRHGVLFVARQRLALDRRRK